MKSTIVNIYHLFKNALSCCLIKHRLKKIKVSGRISYA